MAIRRPSGLVDEQLTHSAIGCFFRVYNALGFGFLEHVYAAALDHELRKRGHDVVRELGIVVRYDGLEIAYQRIDMVVDGKLVVEIKATEKLHKDAARQLFNYLRATNLEVGLLLHFGREAHFYRVFCENRKANPSDP